ncbi:SAV_6107 family HEPN domain-containing protein [Corynebacterium sp. ES2794-CONJ1]|uniref:SAV_6107 family HEPN domain-containing protein n=1 Tax=Corynebacterium sp. ES2794-CONJ1 TaxID=2980553 RepID=UPI0021DB2250|nr:SAV_6107 family HEPN domain-containing protein [Corynebacterium sp. ES2794-CONJ1]MCU9518669.1 SAV_6107 family HEPN domain-containing protein [Corynebacterium sp. ES2794-CONJ1]
MGVVVSASTRFQAGQGSAAGFLNRAQVLTREAVQARDHGRLDIALEYAYLASIKVAAAWVSCTVVAKRKRKPRSVFAQLAMVGGEATQWAQRIGAFSQLRCRSLSGLECQLTVEVLDELIELVAEFYNEVDRITVVSYPAAS